MHDVISRVQHNAVLRERKPVLKFIALFTAFVCASSHPAMLKGQATTQTPPAVSNAPAEPQPAPPATPAPGDYLINAGDVLDVYVYDVPELSHSYPVSPSGTITMPLLPQAVQAAGLTPDELAHSMEEAFRQSGRLQRPDIAISVKQSLGSSVAVEGAVRTPLMVSALGRIKLADVLTQCGGLADDASTTALITRGPLAMQALAAGGGPANATLTVDLKKVMDTTDPASSTPVWPGDRVLVEHQVPDVYYVLGEVRSPGSYTIKNGHDELTFLRALAMAGDVTSVARSNKAYILRKDPKAPTGRDEIKINLASILKRKSPDPRVEAEDILFIPGSNAKKALHTLESAPGMITAGAAGAAIH